jgi:hypothetical protein
MLVDGKREWVGRLTDVLAPYVLNTVQSLMESTRTNRNTRGGGMTDFRRALKDITQWNSLTVARHATQIATEYPYLENLIAACFVAYVKILSSVRLHPKIPNIRLRLPSNDAFVHKVYIHTAREFYNDPDLLRSTRTTLINVVRAAVEASVRDMLPIEDILKAYLGDTVDGENAIDPSLVSDAKPGSDDLDREDRTDRTDRKDRRSQSASDDDASVASDADEEPRSLADQVSPFDAFPRSGGGALLSAQPDSTALQIPVQGMSPLGLPPVQAPAQVPQFGMQQQTQQTQQTQLAQQTQPAVQPSAFLPQPAMMPQPPARQQSQIPVPGGGMGQAPRPDLFSDAEDDL